MIDERNIEVSKVKEVGKIQVAVCNSHSQYSSASNASPIRAIFHSIKDHVIRSIERLVNPTDFSNELTTKVCKLMGEAPLTEAMYREKRKGFAPIVIDKMSPYKNSYCRYHHYQGHQQYRVPLLLIEYTFNNKRIPMLSWNTHPAEHTLENIQVNGYGADRSKFHRGDLEDYVGLYFAFSQLNNCFIEQKLQLNNYFVEQEIDGLKFYAIRLDGHKDWKISERKSKHYRRRQSLDTALFVNYCPYLPYSEPEVKALVPGRTAVADIEAELTERDLLAIRKSIVDDVLRNGLDMSRKKYQHSYALEILNELKDMKRTNLIQLKFELSQKAISLSYPPGTA